MGDVPRYRQIANEFMAQIAGGARKEGERLPSEKALSKERGVAVGTVRRAYAFLEEHGYIMIRPGSGAYVSKMPSAVNGDAAAGQQDPQALLSEMCRAALVSGITAAELMRMILEEIAEAYQGDAVFPVALIDCNYETMHAVEKSLKQEFPFLQIELHLLERLLEGKEMLAPGCRVALIPQKHYQEIFAYSDAFRFKSIPLALKESRSTIEALSLLPGTQEIRIIYRSEAFLGSVLYTLTGLEMKNPLTFLREDRILRDDQIYYGGKASFIVPPDYREFGNARMQQVVGHAEKIGSLIIPFRFEIDEGTLLALRRFFREQFAEGEIS